MNTRKLGVAALSAISLGMSAPAAAVTFGIGGDLGYRFTYGSKGSDLNTFIGCTPSCHWTLALTVPDVPGPLFYGVPATLKLNQVSYAITGTVSTNYLKNDPYDLFTFTGTALPVTVPGVAGSQAFYFNFSFEMPHGTLLATNKRPPTDPDVYLHQLLPGSRVSAALRNFSVAGESGAELSTYDSHGTPTYPVTQFSADGVFAVPEPATWMMMIGGFGVAGAAMRRRKRTAVAA
jgi:hypothetical protein